MAKLGRPPKYNEERVVTLCRALENGEKVEKACKMATIDVSTFYQWIQDKPEFAERIKKAQAAYEDWQRNGILKDALSSLKKLICGTEYEEIKTEYVNDENGNPTIRKQTRINKVVLPNPTAVIFALCNRDPANWKNRVTNEITGKLDTDSEVEMALKKIPDDLLAKVIESIKGI